MSAHVITILSFRNFFFTLSVYLFPLERLSSSTLQTIILGLTLSNPSWFKIFVSSSSIVFKFSSPLFSDSNFFSKICISFGLNSFFFPFSSFF